MSAQGATTKNAVVQITGPSDGWILERLARRLAAKLPYADFTSGGTKALAGNALIYYVNYFLYNGPSGVVDVGFFTHLDESNQFLERARKMDFCVCMSRKYENWLLEQGVKTVTCIPMGFDSYRFRPMLVLGVVGLLDHARKGRTLVEEVRKLPFVEVLTTEGRVPHEQLPEFYHRLDYVLIPATVEGGPMSLLEGLGMGKSIIAPDDVGMVPEFGDTEHIRRYPTGDASALVQLIHQCYEEKLARRRLVEDRTWDAWAQAHHHLFRQLLEARGMPFPRPCLGFRFGMISELDVPLGIDVGPLETGIDQAARHLYFGEYAQASKQIGDLLPHYPFAAKLLETMPDEQGKFSRRDAGERRAKTTNPVSPTNRVSEPKLGCVLAIQNRPAEYLERTLQTYAYQSCQPADKVLLDYGSECCYAATYKRLCKRYGWRYVPSTPAKPGWSLSAAYNHAVAALSDQVDVVFKSDIDVLLGDDVLATAARLGRDKLCFFSCLTTAEGTRYPDTFTNADDVTALLNSSTPPASMLGEGIHTYPRRWFEEIGGFDLTFPAWGFEDSDLRVRAQKSIGIVNDASALLIHQSHPRPVADDQAAKNRAHYERMKTGPVVRNGGRLVEEKAADLCSEGQINSDRSPVASVSVDQPSSAAAKSRLVFATRSMNDVLFRICGELLGLDRLREHFCLTVDHRRLTGTDAFGYFRELLALDADWVVSVDEDVFVLEPGRIVDLIAHMEEKGFAACGVPDGGVVSIRAHNPVACNAFFNVFDMRRVRGAWKDWNKVLASKHQQEFEKLVPAFARRTPFAFDQFEPYYGAFFSLLDAGERILYLDAEEWQDGMTTLVKDQAGEPLLLHGWYSRSWDTNPDTQSRYRIAVEYARWKQGLARVQWESSSPSPLPDHTILESNLGKWEALFSANRDPFPFGDTQTYEKAAAFLGDLASIEDWGCGRAWFRRYLKPSVRYKGIDCSRSPELEHLADLTGYTSQTEGILLRHVLEHNEAWELILRNAVQSFTRRMVIVLFTPFSQTTRQLAYNPTIRVPDISFAKDDLVRHFTGVRWKLEENLRTKTQYNVEHVFYLER